MKILTSATIIYTALVFGLAEFFAWLTGGHGLIGGLILDKLGISFFLLQNPFLSLYLLLPCAWSTPVLNQVKEGLLARFPLMYTDWSPKISWGLQGFCYVILVVLCRQIFGDIIEGETLSPENFGFTFSLIIFLTFFIQLVLRNLPVIKRVPVRVTALTILDNDSTGLYAFDHQRFCLEDIPGITDEFNLLVGPQRRYKDKNTVWFVFQQNSTQLKTENVITKIGKIEVDYSYYVNVTNNPNRIRVREVELAGIESNEQLNIKIKQDLENLFPQDIYKQAEYQHLNNIVDSFFLNCRIVSDDLVSIMEQAIKLEILRCRLDEVTNQFKNFNQNYDLYGRLYHIKLCLNQVKIQTDLIARLERLEERIKELIQDAYQQARDKEEFFVKLYNGASERISSDNLDNLFNDVINNILSKSPINNCSNFENNSHNSIKPSTSMPINQNNEPNKLQKSETPSFKEQLEQQQQIQNNQTDDDSFFKQRFNGNNNS